MPDVSVAIPVLVGGALFAEVLRALASQTVAHELIVCDSGSRDGSLALARESGARVIEIEPESFSHGSTRNLLVQSASGARVAMLTQDAVPVDKRWLERLLGGFALAPDVAIVYGPYRPRPQASPAVRIELESWFHSLAPDGAAQVERLDERERVSLPAVELIGRRGFFTDANACIDRAAWQRVPFRRVPYAEDRLLAIDMLRAGYAKAYVPEAAVVHSHAYTPTQQLRRCFDEWCGLRQVYGWREPAAPRHVLSRLRGSLGQARVALSAEAAPRFRRAVVLAQVLAHQLVCLCGALLGSRAERLPSSLRRAISLEGHAGFAALDQREGLRASEEGPGSEGSSAERPADGSRR
jgi:GT2 family glycosyltransferase